MNLSSLGLFFVANMLGSPVNAPKQAEPDKAPIARLTPMGTGWGLGASGGITSGFGISLRRHFPQRLGFQATAFYLPLGEGNHWMSFGAQGFYSILRGRIARFYGLTGAHLMIDASAPAKPGFREVTSYTTPPEAIWSKALFVGLGLGLELHFTPWLGWAFEVPLSAMIDLDKSQPDQTLKDKIRLVPAANMSLTFYFK